MQCLLLFFSRSITNSLLLTSPQLSTISLGYIAKMAVTKRKICRSIQCSNRSVLCLETGDWKCLETLHFKSKQWVRKALFRFNGSVTKERQHKREIWTSCQISWIHGVLWCPLWIFDKVWSGLVWSGIPLGHRVGLMRLLMIHKACMPVYIVIQIFLACMPVYIVIQIFLAGAQFNQR